MFKFFKALSENTALQGQIQLLKTEKQQLIDKFNALNKELNQTREILGKTQIRHAQELQRYADVETRMQKARKAYKSLRIQQQEDEVKINGYKKRIAGFEALTQDNTLAKQLDRKEQELHAQDTERKESQEKYQKIATENEKLSKDLEHLQEKVRLYEKTKKAQQQKRILIVDDSITTRTLMKKILESAQYEVHLAKDGLEGQEIIKTTPLDIIVTDADMPNLDGFELTRWIKKESKTPDVPIIMIASMTDKNFQEKAEAAGVSSFITKNNFQQQVFLNTIETTLNPD